MAETATSIVEQLQEAKHNVQWLLDHPKGLVDMHGLSYWAGVVERLRKSLEEL